MDNTINILLIEDEKDWIYALEDILKKEPRLKLHEAARDSFTALEIIRTKPIDLVLLDYHLKESDIWGVELAVKLLHLKPSIQIIFWSIHVFERVLIEAKKAGAVGYINKSSPDADAISRLLIKVYEDSKNDKKIWIEHPSHLEEFLKHQFTPREQEILSKIAQVKTHDQIALELGVKIRLVSAHILNIKEKVFIRKYGRPRKQGTKDKNGKWTTLPEPNVSIIEVIEFAIKEFPCEDRKLSSNEIMGKLIFKCIYRQKITWEDTALLYDNEIFNFKEILKDFISKLQSYFFQNDSSISRTAIRFKLEHFEVEKILTIKLDDLT